jgi:hypothetical protein
VSRAPANALAVVRKDSLFELKGEKEVPLVAELLQDETPHLQLNLFQQLL